MGGVVAIFFIAKYLSPNEQGYYYTFASVLSVQIFFELGLSGIITQYAAHEFVHLKWGENQILLGNEYNKSRLSSLLRFCVKCFAIISIVFFFVLLVAGFAFFSKYNKANNIFWKNPWIILCFSTSLNLFIDPILAFFDGIGEIEDMSTVRLIQKTSNVFILFLCFFLGFKLYSAAFASLIGISINYIQICSQKRLKLLKSIWNSKEDEVINYYKEIFPYQWKIALSWISGYFIFQLFNPVLFATEGPRVAGQMGMTLTALNGIAALSMSWISTKIPLFSSLIAKKEYKQLDIIFDKAKMQLTGINILLISIFISSIALLNLTHLQFASRFLPLLSLFFLSLTVIANQFVFSWATYLRCHKKEPFLITSIVGGVLCAVSTYVLGKIFGLMGIIIGYTCITFFLMLWSYLIFKNKKASWHQ